MDYQELKLITIESIAKLEVDYKLVIDILEKQCDGGKIMPDSALYKRAIDINTRLVLYKNQLYNLCKQQGETRKPIRYNCIGLPIW